jgi:hypothetical protein
MLVTKTNFAGTPQEAVAKFIAESRQSIGAQFTKPEDVMAHTTKVATSNAEAMMRNTNTEKNIYKAALLPDLAGNKAVSDTTLFKVALAPLIAAGLDDSSPDKVIAAGEAAVKAGTLTAKELVDGVTTVYQNAVIYNNLRRNYAGFGLPVQKSYQAPVNTQVNSMLFPSSTTVDLTKSEQVTKLMMLRQTNSQLNTGRKLFDAMVTDPLARSEQAFRETI